MTYAAKVKRANEHLALARAGTTVWWRREAYHKDSFAAVEPRWHILVGREKSGDYDAVWKAACGYKHLFRERILHDFPRLRKNRPVRVVICTKCLRRETP